MISITNRPDGRIMSMRAMTKFLGGPSAGAKPSRLGRFGVVGSYVVVFLLPGGSLIALLMYAYQLKRAGS
jgi:hypothetical protein